MESANLYEHHHHHQLQPQLLYSSLASSSPSSHGVSALHDWNPSMVLDGYEFNRYTNEILPNSPSLKGPSLQEIRFGDARSFVHPPANHKLQFENTKGSMSDNFLKLSDMNRSSSGSFDRYSYRKNEHQDQDVIDLNENLSWLSSYYRQKLSSCESYSNGESFARFGVADVAPAAASSFMSSCSTNHLYASTSLLSASSPSLQLAADPILSYTNGVKGSNQSYQERNSLSYFHVQQSSHSPSNSSNKTSTFRNEASTTEKLSACSTHEVVAKKPRLSSSSCPTLKVRKEKLGDRIAALHRLVSPFGKTDTASVLTEAIGYIQFLQDQIQTLSMSYLKSSSRSKSCRTTRGDLMMKDNHHQKEDEPSVHQDLRSRGLCLVPLAFTSYICSYNGSL